MEKTKTKGWSVWLFKIFEFHFKNISKDQEEILVVGNIESRGVFEFQIKTNDVEFWEEILERFAFKQISNL